jgi:hypothetical protein
MTHLLNFSQQAPIMVPLAFAGVLGIGSRVWDFTERLSSEGALRQST